MGSILFLGGTGYAKFMADPYLNAAIKALDLHSTYAVYDSAFSPDGKWCAFFFYGGNKYAVLELSTGAEVTGLPSIQNTGRGGDFSPDSGLLAIAHDSGNGLTVINTTDWSIVASTPSIGGNGQGCAFSPDGTMLAVAHTGTNKLAVYDTATWQEISTGIVLSDTTYSVAFSKNGNWLAVGYRNGNGIAVYDTATWQEITVPSLPTYQEGRCVRFSNNSAFLAIAHPYGDGCTIIKTADWSKISPHPNLGSNGNACAFSYDDSKLAFLTRSAPGIVVLETTGFAQIQGVTPVETNLNTCAFSPAINVPARELEYKTATGEPASKAIKAINPDTVETILETTTDAAGKATIYSIAPTTVIASATDQIDPTNRSASLVQLDGQSEQEPALLIVDPYIGDMVTISSNLSTQSGAAGDEVVIRNWNTRELVAKVIPDANGDWSAQVPPGTYDVSYIAENCAPVIHGPYTVELP